MMQLKKAIDGFLLSCSAEGYSKHTISDYGINLKRFAKQLGNPDVTKISKKDVTSFFAWLREDYQPRRMNGDLSPLKPATLNRAWGAIRSFFNWAISLSFQ
jgi:site-specific recombinase XerD